MTNESLGLFELLPDEHARKHAGGWTHELAGDPVNSLHHLSDPASVRAAIRTIPWDFANANTTYLSHDIHPYPAKYAPPVPANLIAQLSVPGDTVWDPFGGSGTTSLEAALLNRHPISTDANPLAAIVGRAKTTAVPYETHLALSEWADELAYTAKSPGSLGHLLREVEEETSASIPPIPNIEKWFHKKSIAELAYLRWTIERNYDPSDAPVPYVALSRTVQRVSFQESETRYVRKPREVHTGETLRTYARELQVCLNRSAAITSLLGFRSAPFGTADMARPFDDIEAHLGDVGISDNSVDLIVTSPPYPNSTDYHLYHRFRMFWLGMDPRDLGRIEIGSHLRHQRQKSGFSGYIDEMSVALQTCFRALRSGRYAAFVIGDAKFDGQTYSTADSIAEAAAACGFEKIDTIDRNLPEHRRSFAKPGRRARDERIVILRKPECTHTYTIHPPSYGLSDYERELQLAEAKALLGPGVRRSRNDQLTVRGTSTLVSNLRRLTFSRAFESRNFCIEKTWQARLENGAADSVSRRKESNYVTHGLHPYKGKFYPQLVHSLLNIGKIEQGARLLDPYCGSGTLLTEAALHGVHSCGVDMSPIAALVARAKTQSLTLEPAFVDRVLSQLIAKIDGWKAPSNAGWRWLSTHNDTAIRELERWFPMQVLAKVGSIMQEIRSVPEPIIQQLLTVITSSVVRDISQQDPDDLRVRRRKVEIEDAPVFDLVKAKLLGQREKLRKYYGIRHLSPDALGTAQVTEGDSTKWGTLRAMGVEENSLDAMITSPPYATALPYIDTYRLSLLLLFGKTSTERRPIEQGLTGSREINTADRRALDADIEAGDFNWVYSDYAKELITEVYWNNKNAGVGFRRRNQAALLLRYFRQLTATLRNCDRALAEGAPVFIILGNNFTKAGAKEICIDTIRATREIGTNIGWKDKGGIDITVTKDNHRNRKNAITENEILCLQK